ncbi:MAG: LPS assembly lipoprotein LptE [Myxococcota bacterium]|nr:LPS assembly lipoprotein LptE [Myxococcota bacterium]
MIHKQLRLKMIPARTLVLTLVLCVSACSYQWGYQHKPHGLEAIEVLPVKEKAIVGTSAHLTLELQRELNRIGIPKSSPSDQVGTLHCEILNSNTRATSLANADRSFKSYTINMKVRVTLETKDGKILWKKTFTTNEDFLRAVGSKVDPIIDTETGRQRSLIRMNHVLARRVIDTLNREGRKPGNP